MEGGPPCFPQTHRGSWYSGCQHRPRCRVPYGTLTLSGGAFQHLRVRHWAGSCWSYNPSTHKECWFGLLPVRSPLLRESRLISLRQGTEMFQFPCCPPCGLCIQPPVARHHSGGVAPLGYSGLIARMQLPLNVSPVSASFFGLQRLGILLVLSLACSSALFFSSLLVSASAKLK